MESPYLRFVRLVASVVNGRYPEHYDSGIKKRVRYLWLVGIPLFAVLAYLQVNMLEVQRLTTKNALSSTTTLGYTIVLIIFSVLTWRIAGARSASIQEYILETNPERVITENSSETAQDAIHISEYVKTYFVLAGLSELRLLVNLIAPWSYPVGVYLRFILFIPGLYYVFILIDLLFPILVRWGRQYIKNDNVSQNTSSSES